MAKVPNLPSSVPGAELLPYLTARARNQVVETVFEMVGGTERMADWADKNYGEFLTKLWVKGLPSNSVTEHTVSQDSIEAFWDEVDKREKTKAIEGQFTEVESCHAPDSELVQDGETEECLDGNQSR